MRTGIHSGIPRSAHRNNAGAPAVSPADWNPFEYWDADEGVTIGTGVSAWAGRVNGWGFVQSTPANQPTLSAADAGWNSRDVIQYDGTNDALHLDTADLSLVNQRFFHDDTTDWELLLPFMVVTGAANNGYLFATGAVFATTGIFAQFRTGNTELRIGIQNGATAVATLSTGSSSVILNTAQFLRLNYTTSTRVLSAKIDSGTPVTATGTGPVATGDAEGSLCISARVAGTTPLADEGPHLFTSKTKADAGTTTEQTTYYDDRYGL